MIGIILDTNVVSDLDEPNRTRGSRLGWKPKILINYSSPPPSSVSWQWVRRAFRPGADATR